MTFKYIFQEMGAVVSVSTTMQFSANTCNSAVSGLEMLNCMKGAN